MYDPPQSACRLQRLNLGAASTAGQGNGLAHMERLSDLEHERLARTIEAVPAGVRNGLEIGFNDLRVTRLLAQQLDLVSIDLPHRVSNEGRLKLAFADIKALPFADKAFDLVVCTEVLEHLSDSVLKCGARELTRVARSYVLVTVPYQEDPKVVVFKCAQCGYVGNAWGHVRTFDEDRLSNLFPQARTVAMRTIARVPGSAPSWMYALTHHLGNSWDPVSGDRCPACDAAAQTPKENALGYLLRRVLWRVERFASPRPAWLLALFAV
jgi:hypothetical protein